MESGENGGNALSKIGAWPERLREYLGELRSEMGRVTWPSWKQVQATTAVVLATIFVFGVYFFLIDLLLGRAIQRVLATFTR